VIKKLPEENIYGHTKKLKYILGQIYKLNKTRQSIINLLDFGCGNGSAVSQYLISDEINYYGVDIHLPSLEHASNMYSQKNAHFLVDVPNDILFDVIVYADILEHLSDPESVLIDHHEKLSHGGIVIGAVPNGYGPFELEKKADKYLGITRMINKFSLTKRYIKSKYIKKVEQTLLQINEGSLPYNEESGHVQFFTKKQIYRIFESCGYKPIDFRNGAFLGAPVITGRILLGSKIAKINAQIGNVVPYWLASTGYFTFHNND